MKRIAIVAVVLLGAGVALGQIIPNGNRPPRNTTAVQGGGDYFVGAKVPIIDAQGRPHQPLDGLFRVFRATGQVEVFMIVVNADGTKTARWVPAIDVAVAQ